MHTGHRAEAARGRAGSLHNSSDPERLSLRENPSRTTAFGRGLHPQRRRHSQSVVAGPQVDLDAAPGHDTEALVRMANLEAQAIAVELRSCRHILDRKRRDGPQQVHSARRRLSHEKNPPKTNTAGHRTSRTRSSPQAWGEGNPHSARKPPGSRLQPARDLRRTCMSEPPSRTAAANLYSTAGLVMPSAFGRRRRSLRRSPVAAPPLWGVPLPRTVVSPRRALPPRAW
jgi:hypothetical protein